MINQKTKVHRALNIAYLLASREAVWGINHGTAGAVFVNGHE